MLIRQKDKSGCERVDYAMPCLHTQRSSIQPHLFNLRNVWLSWLWKHRSTLFPSVFGVLEHKETQKYRQNTNPSLCFNKNYLFDSVQPPDLHVDGGSGSLPFQRSRRESVTDDSIIYFIICMNNDGYWKRGAWKCWTYIFHTKFTRIITSQQHNAFYILTSDLY